MSRFRPRLVALEDRSTPATMYVSQSFTVTNDTAPAGLSAGDTVTFGGMFPINGLTFGTNAFTSLSAAIAAAAANDKIQFSGETHTVETGQVIDKPLTFVGTIGAQPSSADSVLRPASDAAVWFDVTGSGKLDLTFLALDGLVGTRTIGQAIHFASGSQGGSLFQARLTNLSGVGVVNEASDALVTLSTFTNVGGGVQFLGGGTQTFGQNTYNGRGSGGSGEVAVAVQTPSGATVVVSGNTIKDASGSAVAAAAISGTTVNVIGNSLTNSGTGLSVTGSSPAAVVAQYNAITGNGVGVSSTGAAVDAKNVWWGSFLGPVAPNNTTTGTGVTTSPPLDGGPPPIIFGTSPADYTARAGTPNQGGGGGFGVVTTLVPAFDDGRTSPLVFGAGAGSQPTVTVRLPDDTTTSANFLAYDAAFTGGVRVAVNREAKIRTTVATAPGPGGAPHVKLFGLSGTERASFYAYDPSFDGGVYVALADVNDDGVPDIITGAGEGGAPHVKVFDGATLEVLASFFAFDESFRGGVRVATLNRGNATPPAIVAATGPGAEARVRGFNLNRVELFSISPYEWTFTGGVFVAGGDVDADGVPDLITGAGEGGAGRVRVYEMLSGPMQQTLPLDFSLTPLVPTAVRDFYAFDGAERTGVTVAAGESGPLVDGVATQQLSERLVKPGEIVVGGGGRVRVISSVTGEATFDGTVSDGPGVVSVAGLGVPKNTFPLPDLTAGPI